MTSTRQAMRECLERAKALTIAWMSPDLHPTADDGFKVIEQCKACIAALDAEEAVVVDAQTDTIIRMLEWWLEWNAKEYDESGTPCNDETFILRFPTHPTRGMFKAWIEHLRTLAQKGG